jgi:hypothetical protein
LKRRWIPGLLLVLALAAVTLYIQYQPPEGIKEAGFNLTVVPRSLRESVPGQRCVFLVTVEDLPGAENAGPVIVTAEAPDAVVEVERGQIVPGEVAEVSVTPAAATAERNITVTITGSRGGEKRTTVFIPLVLGDNVEPELAPEVRDRFVSWLEENRPELSITMDTQWTGTLVTPRFLVVTHYLFFSEEWEMHVCWHVMIEPHNWARCELRRRFEETAPSYAFQIPSLTEDIEPSPIEPPEEVWR